MEQIKNLEEVDIIEWLRTFEWLKKQLRWTEENIQLILKNMLCYLDLEEEFFDCSFEKMKMEIIRLKYPKSSVMTILRNLERTYQKKLRPSKST